MWELTGGNVPVSKLLGNKHMSGLYTAQSKRAIDTKK